MIYIVCCGLWPSAYAQSRSSNGNKAPLSSSQIEQDRVQLRWVDTISAETVAKGFITHGVCKDYRMRYPLLVLSPVVRAAQQWLAPVNTRPPLLKISGNILYDLNYRSRLDTPYAANELYQ